MVVIVVVALLEMPSTSVKRKVTVPEGGGYAQPSSCASSRATSRATSETSRQT